MLIDFHSHDPAPEPGICKVVSLPASALRAAPEAEGVYYSLELHPWGTAAGVAAVPPPGFAELAASKKVVAIGEIGLDRLRGAPLAEQMVLLDRLLTLAETVGKPVILHCVRAYGELQSVLSAHPRLSGVLLHGVKPRAELLREWTLRFGFDVSLGAGAWHSENLYPALRDDARLREHCLVERDASGGDLGALYAELKQKFSDDPERNAERRFERLFGFPPHAGR